MLSSSSGKGAVCVLCARGLGNSANPHLAIRFGPERARLSSPAHAAGARRLEQTVERLERELRELNVTDAQHREQLEALTTQLSEKTELLQEMAQRQMVDVAERSALENEIAELNAMTKQFAQRAHLLLDLDAEKMRVEEDGGDAWGQASWPKTHNMPPLVEVRPELSPDMSQRVWSCVPCSAGCQ